ncbi:hypothetical protein V6N13_057817 [Hibiscus sabdariffa]
MQTAAGDVGISGDGGQSQVTSTQWSVGTEGELTGEALELGVLESETTREMVVCYSHHLHERVDDCWPHTSKAPSYQIFAYDICFWSFNRNLTRISESANDRLVVNKAPDILVE